MSVGLGSNCALKLTLTGLPSLTGPPLPRVAVGLTLATATPVGGGVARLQVGVGRVDGDGRAGRAVEELALEAAAAVRVGRRAAERAAGATADRDLVDVVGARIADRVGVGVFRDARLEGRHVATGEGHRRGDVGDRDGRGVVGEAAVLVDDPATDGPAARAVGQVGGRHGRRGARRVGHLEGAVVVEVVAVRKPAAVRPAEASAWR